MAAEAVAKAKAEVALRGLNATVIQDYYAIVSAQRRFANAQTSLREADQFLDISQKQEKGGEVAHADVIKAQITQQQRQRDLQDADLNIEKARIALGVLIFPDFRSDYAVEDDLQQPSNLLPPFPEARAKATATSPDLRAAQAEIEQAGYDVNVARYAFLPSLGVDFFYGIDANQFAASASNVDDTGRAVLPQYDRAQPAESWLLRAGNVEHPRVELGRDAEQNQAGGAQAATGGTRSDSGAAHASGERRVRLQGSADGAGASGFSAQFVRSFGGEPAADAAEISGRRSQCARSGGRANDAGTGAQRV